MRYEGAALTAILTRQTHAVRLAGCIRGDVSAAEALALARAGHYVGTGNRNRIKLLEPARLLMGWHGRHTTQRIRNDAGEIVAPDYHLEHKPLVKARPVVLRANR